MSETLADLTRLKDIRKRMDYIRFRLVELNEERAARKAELDTLKEEVALLKAG